MNTEDDVNDLRFLTSRQSSRKDLFGIYMLLSSPLQCSAERLWEVHSRCDWSARLASRPFGCDAHILGESKEDADVNFVLF